MKKKENDRLGSGCWRIRQAVNMCRSNTSLSYQTGISGSMDFFSESRFSQHKLVLKRGGFMRCSENCLKST